MTLKLYGSGSIENVDSIVTSASANISGTELGFLDGINGIGKIVQAVSGQTGSEVSSSSSSWVDTGLTATITPTSTNNKIIIIVNQNGVAKFTTNTWVGLRLLRNSTAIRGFESNAGRTDSTATNVIGGSGTVMIDSPATTNGVTYKTQIYNSNNSGLVFAQINSSISSILLLEVLS